MVPSTMTLSARTALATTPTEHWFAVRNRHTYIPISVSISVGTATLVIEGRNTPDDAAVVLDTFTETDAHLVQHMNQLRVRYTEVASAPDVVVSLDFPALDTGA